MFKAGESSTQAGSGTRLGHPWGAGFENMKDGM